MRACFAPHAARRKELLADTDGLKRILAHGAAKARHAGAKTLQKVRKKTGLAY